MFLSEPTVLSMLFPNLAVAEQSVLSLIGQSFLILR